jgi:nondiscriminating glutamyl-tRNA synthetase
MLDLARQNAHTLAGLADEVASLAKGPDLGQEPASSLLAQTGAQPSLRALLQSLPAAPWDGLEALKASLKAAQQGSGFKGKDFFMPLRAALTGAEHGPELPRVLQALGREEGTARLSRALAAIIKES